MNQRYLISLIILAGIGSIGSVLAYSGTISAGQGNFNNVLVTGTCTGCSGDGSFTTYSNFLNQTITGTSGFLWNYIYVGTDGSVEGQDHAPDEILVTGGGTKIYVSSPGISTTNLNMAPSSVQSINGVYRAIMNATDNTITVYKNNSLLQKLGINVAQLHDPLGNSNYAVGISSDGKYIALAGTDTSGTIDRLLIFRGS